jgi:hypothetical protein
MRYGPKSKTSHRTAWIHPKIYRNWTKLLLPKPDLNHVSERIQAFSYFWNLWMT